MDNKNSNKEKYFYYNKNTGDTMVADHLQRMFMDGLRYMLEAMIEDELEVAEAYSKMHPDLTEAYNEFKEMSLKQLIEERLVETGYTPDDNVDNIFKRTLQNL
jgi:hypothetical protein